ncbi:MAG: exopolysaccharide Pel transporter PelG [Burkholderiales bacterium]
MAGIGFELRKLLEKRSYFGLFQAYAYAGVISSGPWVLSIVGILMVGILSASVVVPATLVQQFQVSVTYLIMLSLILSGPLQIAFTRFIADRLFEKKESAVLPNFMGALLTVMAISGVLGMLLVLILFPRESDIYRILMLAGFVILNGIWMSTLMLSGLKQYKQIVGMFAFGYIVVVASALALRKLGMEGLLFGFVLGHLVLLIGMVTVILRNFPSDRLIAFGFARRRAMFPALMMTGLLYNLAVWADKLMFWYFPDTGQPSIGPLNASLVYDLPVFLAYLAIIPGMAVFLIRIETDFVEYFDKFYTAVREGGSLDTIERNRDEMISSVRQGLFEIVKIQTIAVLVVMVAGPALLEWIGISQLYLSLLYIQVVAAGLQVVLLGILNVLFYLDRRREVVVLTGLLLVANVGLTGATLKLGAYWYGYGFAVALLITVFTGLILLERKLETLEYETFMLQ